VFVYDALLEALNSGDTSIPCIEFRQAYQELCEIGATGKSSLQQQYEVKTNDISFMSSHAGECYGRTLDKYVNDEYV